MKTNKTTFLIAVVAVLLCGIAIQQCSEEVAKLKLLQAEKVKHETELQNKVASYCLQRENAKIDSVKKQIAAETFKAKTDAIIYKSEAERLKKKSLELERQFNEMIRSQSPCPEMLKAAVIRIDTLKAENSVLNEECESLEAEAIGYSKQLYLCEQQRTNTDTLLIASKGETVQAIEVIKRMEKLQKRAAFKAKLERLGSGVVAVCLTIALILK